MRVASRRSTSWLLLGLALLAGASAASEYAQQRAAMVREIAAEARIAADESGRSSFSPRVMAALGRVPRHRFVPLSELRYAYDNRPLPIGHGQTISQPFIVALMTDLLGVQAGDKVLEIGTGSGYQAAVLAELGCEIYSIEIIEPLGREARARLRRLGYAGVEVRIADGYYGWESEAPFDGIIVTAAPNHVPPPLVRQLKPGARMVIPVGSRFLTQHLMLVERQTDGTVQSRQILPVRFVPFTGEH